ncbi:MAG TPA: regulatory protein RecX [Chryseolinea sp.]|nr:regulatory protein RecX [Chryseolinea sp.]
MEIEEAKQKIFRYCAYQERCHSEVRNRLYTYGLYRNDIDNIIIHLISEGFLNEERFAKAYAGGKFRMKQWGKLKIQIELELRGLTKNCIAIGLKEIDTAHYNRTLEQLILKKRLLLEEDNTFVLRDKIAQYVIHKGYEPELVWSTIKAIIPK